MNKETLSKGLILSSYIDINNRCITHLTEKGLDSEPLSRMGQHVIDRIARYAIAILKNDITSLEKKFKELK